MELTTLDEVIQHCKEVAEKNEKQASWFWCKEGNPNYEKCAECAAEHRQLEEWLKDYKRLKEQEPKTGHWIKLPYMAIEADGTLLFSYECSSCKGIGYFRRSEGKIVGGLFCPNCGCRMEGVEE